MCAGTESRSAGFSSIMLRMYELCPLTKCVEPEDKRENSRWNIGDTFWSLTVSWARDRVAIASYACIYIWSLSRREESFKISVDDVNAAVHFVALSEDAKIIVSDMQTVLFDDGTRNWSSLSESLCQIIGE